MAPTGQRGFILVATLWILAIITIAAGYFAGRVSHSLALARQEHKTAEVLVAYANTRADILFQLGTTPFSFYGLGAQRAIALDNRPYRGADGDLVRLQDNRGLLNVNFPDTELIRRLLGQLGVPAEKRDPMIDTLLDYTDTDNLRRLNGAEAPEYAALGLPPPPNDWLATPYQLKNIIGWRDQPELWKNQRLLRLVTTSRIAGFNPNTAPLEVLESLPGSSRDIAAAIVKGRTSKPFVTPEQFFAFAPSVRLDPDFLMFFPSNSIRITQQYPELPWAVQYSVTLTPQSENGPWRVDYYDARIVLPHVAENEDKIPRLPAWAARPPGGDEALQATAR